MLHYYIEKFIYALIFFLFISREQDKSKVWISEMEMQNSWVFFSYPSIVCSILEGQSHVARKSGTIHCCFLVPWSPLSQLQLPPGLLPVAFPEVGAQLQAAMQGGWQCKSQMSPRAWNLQLPLFALPHSVPWGNVFLETSNLCVL